MSGVSGKILDSSLLKRVMAFTRPYRKVFWTAAVSTLLLGVVGPARPWLIQYTFDHYVVMPDPIGLLNMTIAMVALLVMQALLEFLQTYSANRLGQTVVRDLRKKTFRHLSELRLRYFDRTPIGTVVTRAVSDMESIAEIFSDGLLVIFGDIMQLLMIIGSMVYMSWKLTLFSLSVMPILILATWIFKNGIRSAFQDVRTQVARLNAFVQEHVVGMSVVQIFGMEDEEYAKFQTINKAHRKAHIKSVWYYSIFLPVVEILSAISIGVMVWWGAKEAILGLDNGVTLGKMLAFIFFIYALFRPIRQLADKFNTLQMGMVASERVFALLDIQDATEDTGQQHLVDLKGQIAFRDIWFAYNDEDWILKGISFDVKAGETLAIVGATGAGKSTIINILGRYYDYARGSIRIDDADIHQLPLAELRKNVGVVLQDVFLFSDTIYNNITLYDPDITPERVEEAARVVGAHAFISRLPGGYDYNVRERGGMLSVGQRQLISFIRAYVHDPRILVLDEATSSVDTESEELIQYAISRLTENRTSIVIAHRLATVRQADQILVLDHGQVVERGSHDELLRHNGAYKRLYELQFREA
ncbi:MAG: ABC transporter ATP-binding protein [Flavobacteriales bacterium]|nr:ABC transporter ATP-binding protein [Flavobacteriales bacterium]MCB9448788.1 ABC transporter ATP-binding protein [Flavobacteriales bacterium]